MAFRFILKRKLGEGFYLGHWGSLVINPKAVIGKNCNIAQGVTSRAAKQREK